MRITYGIVGALAVALAACAESEQDITGVPELRLGKAVADPTADWVLFDVLTDGVTQAGIRSDGAGTYQAGVCGVRATIFDSPTGSGDAVLNPDADYSSKSGCTRRYFRIAIGSGLQIGAFTNARAVTRLAVGQTKRERMGWNLAYSGCDRLNFGYPGEVNSDSVTITRHADVGGKRRWTVETTGAHRGVCLAFTKGAYVPTSVSYVLPFSLSISER